MTPHSLSFTTPVHRAETRSATHLLPRTWRQVFIFTIILWNAQIFTVTTINPLGIKMFQEILNLFLLVFAAVYLLSQARDKLSIRTIDLIVFFLITGAFFYSAAAARLTFGQPLLFGFIEERRILAFLVYFPLMWAFRKRVMTVHQLFTWTLISALVCAALSIIIASGLVTPIHVKDVSERALRTNRYGIGLSAVSLSILVVVHRFSASRLLLNLAFTLFLLGVLIIVGQTRQYIIATVISIVILRKSEKALIAALPFFLLVLWMVTESQLITNITDKFQSLFGQMSSFETLSESARGLTISTIWVEFARGAWFGSGALSLLWNGGFARVYRSNFFLADVGFFGTFYKFGLFSIPFLFTYLLLQIRSLRAITGHRYYRLILAACVQLLVMSPVAAFIEYRGYISGLLLAASLGCALELREQNRSTCEEAIGNQELK